MADAKISALPSATVPLAGTEVLPIVQAGVTDKITVNSLAAGNLKSQSTTGVLQISGPAAAATRVMTVPDANFSVARTDAENTFTGNQTFSGSVLVGAATASGSTSNNQVVVGGVFYSATGTLSVANASATTFATLPNLGTGIFIVSVSIPGAGGASAYATTALITTQGTSSSVNNIHLGTNVVISMSTLDVQVTQTAGSTYTMSYSVIRLQ